MPRPKTIRERPKGAQSSMLPGRDGNRRWLLSFLFFASGAIGLVYEMIWQRRFSLLFGSAATSTAIILASYFLGLGLGSFFLGRMLKRISRPLMAYAILEGVAGIGALLVEPMISWYETFYGGLGLEGGRLIAVKGMMAFVAIAIPTIALGGTLPALGQLVSEGGEHLGIHVGWLYVLNTAGAALGALAFPYFLLPGFGMSSSNWLCAGTNFAIAGLAVMLSRRTGKMPVKPPKMERAGTGGLLAGLAMWSGFLLFALQVLWNRAFAQVHENSLGAFAVVAALFIVGIALGSELARFLIKRGISFKRSFTALWVSGGVLLIAAPALFVRFTKELGKMGEISAGNLMSEAVGWPMGMMLLVVIFLSGGLPLFLEHLSGQRGGSGTGEIVGKVMAMNAAGSVTGALVAGFILPAGLGMWKSIVVIGTVCALTPMLVIRRGLVVQAISVVVIVLLGGLHLLKELPRVGLVGDEKLLAVREGAHGISAVVERSGWRSLKLNNHYGLGGSYATGDERMQAHLPLLLHGKAEKVVFLGYGTGITAGGGIYHGTSQLTAVELVPEVVSLAGEFFKEENNGFGSRRNTEVVVDDARHYMKGTRERFDVIVGDLVVPWRTGESALYTLEHFRAGHEKLNPGGVYCAWVPMFQLTRKEFEILLRTYLAVFPKAYLFRGDFSPEEPALALVGLRDGAEIGAIPEERFGRAASDPMNGHLAHSSAFWMYYIGVIGRGDAVVEDGKLHTEDKPWLELLSGRGRKMFTGRELKGWQETVLARSGFPVGAENGARAGLLMMEFTLAISEGRMEEAKAVQGQILSLLGAAAGEAVFGK
ncbi:MAG: hypothetical protein SFY81_03415 [Verrucomicrobiota bacterium]|nr:hypothetical protein [Verrucomicrobiota bacterium]